MPLIKYYSHFPVVHIYNGWFIMYLIPYNDLLHDLHRLHLR